VDVRIGIQNSPRELSFETSQTAAEVETAVAAALAGQAAHLKLSDEISGIPYWAVAYGTIAMLDQSLPDEPLVDLARKIPPKPALFIASNELGEPVLDRKYATAYGDQSALWRVNADHTRGLAEHPQAYERRVIAFFDDAL